jgi:hypothetical protein
VLLTVSQNSEPVACGDVGAAAHNTIFPTGISSNSQGGRLQGAPWMTASSLRLLFCGEERRSRGLELGGIAPAAFHGREKNYRAQGTTAMDRESGGRPWEVSLGGGAEGKGGALGGEEPSSLLQGRRAPWEKDLLAAVGTREEEKGVPVAAVRGTRSRGRRGSWSRGGRRGGRHGRGVQSCCSTMGEGVSAPWTAEGRKGAVQRRPAGREGAGLRKGMRCAMERGAKLHACCRGAGRKKSVGEEEKAAGG